MQERSEAERRAIWPCLNVATWRRERSDRAIQHMLTSSNISGTGLTSVANNGIKELGVSVVLFCDECVTTHRHDRVLEAINTQNLPDKYQFPNLEAKFEKNGEKISLMLEMKLNSSEKSLTKVVESKVPSGSKAEIPNHNPKNVDHDTNESLRIQGIPEDFDEPAKENILLTNEKLKDVFNTLGVTSSIVNVKRLGKFDNS